MLDLLSWLYSVAGNVYDWFGSEYWTLRSGAANAWTWAVGQATAAYNNAVNWAWGQIQGLIKNINDLYSWASGQISALQAQITALANGVSAAIYTWVSQQIASITTQLSTLYNEAWTWADKAYNEAIGWVQVQINSLSASLHGAYDWILGLRAGIQNLISLFTPARITALIELSDNLLVDIEQFFADPVGWIIGRLWDTLLLVGEFVIAYAIGSTRDPLPPLPIWGK